MQQQSVLAKLIKLQPRQVQRRKRSQRSPEERARRARQRQARRQRRLLKFIERGRSTGESIEHLPNWKLLVARMEPGEWYGIPDLYKLTPLHAEKSVRINVKQRLFDRGYVERAFNADFDPHRPCRRQLQPRYVYRLSAKGSAARQEWRRELEGYQSAKNP